MASTVAGYPTSVFERFADNAIGSASNMMDLLKKSEEYQSMRDTNKIFREAQSKTPKTGEDGVSTSREGAYSDGTTGSGGGGSGGGNAPSVGDTSQTGDGHIATKGERLDYYKQLAGEFKLNNDALVQTVASEGLHKYVGDNGKSFGDFQLYTGGGMGNQALDAGINIRDPNTWREQARFVAQQMADHRGDAKWFAGQWHGPRDKAPWAVQNFGDPTAVYSGGSSYGTPTRTATAAPTTAPAASGGGLAQVNAQRQADGLPPMTPEGYQRAYGSYGPAPTTAAAPAIAPTPTFASGLRPGVVTGSAPSAPQAQPSTLVPGGGANLHPPGQQAALGGPPPDMRDRALAELYQRPQAPPVAPSVIAQLAAQYAPQQAALVQGAPGSDLYPNGIA